MKRILLTLTVTFFVGAVSAASATTYACFGNEPFWSLSISPNKIVYQKIDDPKTELKPTKPISALGMKSDFVKVYKTHTLGKNVPATIVMTHNENGCSDGMSDKDHQYDVVAVFPNEVLFGCCNRKP